MPFKLSLIDKNNLYHDIRLRIKENNPNEATKSILLLFENFIERNLGFESENDQDEVDTIKPPISNGIFRRVI